MLLVLWCLCWWLGGVFVGFGAARGTGGRPAMEKCIEPLQRAGTSAGTSGDWSPLYFFTCFLIFLKVF